MSLVRKRTVQAGGRRPAVEARQGNYGSMCFVCLDFLGTHFCRQPVQYAIDEFVPVYAAE